jgi:membrane fusion protein (multidrug efflux system)
MKKQMVVAFIAAGLFPLSSCTTNQTAAAAPSSSTSVTLRQPSEKPSYYEATGPVVVENQVEVLAQRDGLIAQVLADTDTSVHKGQILAILDDRQLRADWEAAVAKANAIAADLKNFEAEQKLVEIDLSRDEEMFAASLITQKQLEHSRTRVVGVKYEVERERQNLLNAQAAQKSLELELEKTQISAPFAGVVARRYVRVGQRVRANEKLFWVTATEPLRVNFTVPQNFAGKLMRGQELVAKIAPDGLTYKARIVTVSPVVDPGSGTIEIQAEILPPTRGLLPGETATVRVREPK